MARIYFVSHEERDEYEDLCAEAWSVSADSAEVAAEAYDLLIQAQAAGRDWAARVIEGVVLDGLRSRLSKWRKAQEPKAVVAFDGAVIGSTNTAYSLPRRDIATGDRVHEMTLFAEMSWADVVAVVGESNQRIATANVTRSAAIKLLGLRAAHPESQGPREAAEAEGYPTVLEFLAAA